MSFGSTCVVPRRQNLLMLIPAKMHLKYWQFLKNSRGLFLCWTNLWVCLMGSRPLFLEKKQEQPTGCRYLLRKLRRRSFQFIHTGIRSRNFMFVLAKELICSHFLVMKMRVKKKCDESF